MSGLMSEGYTFVMMIQGSWWGQFRQRHQQGEEVHSYVQKGAGPPKETRLILFYVTKPVAKIAGYAEFIERKVGETDDLWNKFGPESVFNSKEKYDEFLRDYQKASFVRFKNLREAVNPIPLRDFLSLLGTKGWGRRGFYMDKGTTDKLLALME